VACAAAARVGEQPLQPPLPELTNSQVIPLTMPPLRGASWANAGSLRSIWLALQVGHLSSTGTVMVAPL